MRTLMVSLLIVALAAPGSRAREPDLSPASAQIINDEARYLGDLPGPQPGTHRAIFIWRAPSTPGEAPLPTLYMADGARGVYVVAARLRPAIEAGLIPAVQVIGMEPDLRHRDTEYGAPGRAVFNAHERWVLEVVIPWAERVARASPQQRAVGGYSNGADFALAMGRLHPDVFSGVLAHSPLLTQTFDANARASGVRWALSAGIGEFNGWSQASVHIATGAVRGRNAAVRSCVGAWNHDYEKWLDLSPGAVAWMFNFARAAQIETPLERPSCHVEGSG